MTGRIKIHRKIDGWGWRSKPNTFSLFLYLLTNANNQEKKYLGHIIRKGDCVIGRKALAIKLGITEDQVRTSLEHLKSTQEITIKTTNKFSVITVCKWEDYQIQEDKTPSSSPNKSPTNPQQIPTPKEYKNNKNIYISEKKQISDLLEKEYIQNWKGGLKIMWELFIEKGYNIEAKQKSILDFIDWLKKKSKTTFGTTQQGDYLWDKTYNAIEDCMEYHKSDRTMIVNQTHKSRVNTWFGNKQNGFTNKK